jgi:hypothetical protein
MNLHHLRTNEFRILPTSTIRPNLSSSNFLRPLCFAARAHTWAKAQRNPPTSLVATVKTLSPIPFPCLSPSLPPSHPSQPPTGPCSRSSRLSARRGGASRRLSARRGGASRMSAQRGSGSTTEQERPASTRRCMTSFQSSTGWLRWRAVAWR